MKCIFLLLCLDVFCQFDKPSCNDFFFVLISGTTQFRGKTNTNLNGANFNFYTIVSFFDTIKNLKKYDLAKYMHITVKYEEFSSDFLLTETWYISIRQKYLWPK